MMKYHLTMVRMAIIKILQIINAGEGVEEGTPSYVVDKNVSWCSCYGKQMEVPQKTKDLLPI